MSLKSALTMLAVSLFIGISSAEIIEVTNTNVDGQGSLTEAINIANSDASLTNIVFNIAGGGRIVTGSAGSFPEITTPIEIDGSNAGGLVTIIGSSPTGPGAPVSGLVFMAGSENSVVKNVTTDGFLYAVLINTDNITVTSCTFVGTFAHAIKISNSSSDLIEKCTFENIGSLAIRITDGSEIGILENSFTSEIAVTAFIVAEASRRLTIGIPGRGNTFDGNTSSANGAVMLVGAGYGSQIIGNTFKNAQGSGVYIAGNNRSEDRIELNTFENNIGWDIKVVSSFMPTIARNTITGDAQAMSAGIYLEQVDSAIVEGNTLDGARISLRQSNYATIGGVGSDKNIVKNDPQGFSGSAAIILDSTYSCAVINNDVVDNTASGILLQNYSSKNAILYNTISNNGRTGVRVISGNQNKIGQNIIFGQHADAMGGINSISLLGGANDNKEAPVITSIAPSYDVNTVLVSGEGVPGDRIELCKSTKPASIFSVDAIGELGFSVVGADGKWSANVNVANMSDPVLYLTSIATDGAGNSSELSGVASYVLSDGIVGPIEVRQGIAYNFSIQDFEGVHYDWWANGWVNLTGNGTNSVEVIFMSAPQTNVTLSVGFQHPENGWTVKTVTVTVVE